LLAVCQKKTKKTKTKRKTKNQSSEAPTRPAAPFPEQSAAEAWMQA
jgi:hypothetical protein